MSLLPIIRLTPEIDDARLFGELYELGFTYARMQDVELAYQAFDSWAVGGRYLFLDQGDGIDGVPAHPHRATQANTLVNSAAHFLSCARRLKQPVHAIQPHDNENEDD